MFTVHPLPRESAAQISFGKGCSLFTPCLVNLLHRFRLGKGVNCSSTASWICCTDFNWEGVFTVHPLPRKSAAQILFAMGCSLFTPCLVNLLHRFQLGRDVKCSPPASWFCCTDFVWEGVFSAHPLLPESAAQISFGKEYSLLTPCLVNLLHRFRLGRGVLCSSPASWICCTDFVWEGVFTIHPLHRESAAQTSFGKGCSLLTPCLVNLLHRFRLVRGVHYSPPAPWICCTNFVWEWVFTVHPLPRESAAQISFGKGCSLFIPCLVNLLHRFRLGKGVNCSPTASWICCTDFVWEGVFTVHPLPRKSAAQILFAKGCSLFTHCLVNLLHRFRLGRDVNYSPPASWICCTDFVWEGVFSAHPLLRESAAQISFGKEYSLLTPCLVNLLHEFRLGRGVHCLPPAS